ncbi:MAG: sulfatase [Verrucomicrobiota bacterium]|nr:sulfatase [Verrucomicrobiota bacterium]
MMSTTSHPERSPALTATLLLPLLLGAALAAGCRPATESPAAASGPAQGDIQEGGPLPHILWITLDTLRRDAVDAYAPDTAADTPTLNALAQGGLLFEQAVVPIPTTLTSHTAMFTGLTPRRNGVRSAGDRVPDSLQLLAEVLKEQGYQTAAFVSAAILDRAFNLTQGFDHYDDTKARDQRRAEETVTEALSWLSKAVATTPNQPVFLWLHLFDPHSPYDPPAELARKTTRSDYSGPIDGSTQQLTLLNLGRGPELNGEDLEHLRGLYLAEVEYTDRWTGRFLDGAQQHLGGLDNTLIVALSDHGENLGEQGRFFHGFDLFDTSVRIPMIMTWPRVLPANQRVRFQTRTIDLMPSILSMLGLPAPPALEGADWSRAWSNQGPPPPESPALMETEHPLVNESDRLVGLRTERWKYLAYSLQKGPPILFAKRVELPLLPGTFATCFTQISIYANLVVNVRFPGDDIRRYTIRGERFGTDPVHRDAVDRGRLPAAVAPEVWTLRATPDLYARAEAYAQLQGWPLEGASIEAIGIELTPPIGQRELKIAIDEVHLVFAGANPPAPPPGLRGETGRWVIEDFSARGVAPFTSADNPRIEVAKTGWMPESALPGEGSEGIHIALRVPEEPLLEDALFDWHADPLETTDLLHASSPADLLRMARDLNRLLGDWIEGTDLQRRGAPAVIAPEAMDRFRALGYLQ